MGDLSTPQTVQRLFSLNLRKIISEMKVAFDNLQEIRLRSDKPIIVMYDNEEYFLKENGELTKDISSAYFTKNSEIKETMEYVCNYSMYAFEEEIRQGYITVMGGHRIGICGKAVIENNEIKTIKYISFINMRFSHQVIGCADNIMKYIYKGAMDIHNTLIISPPRCGKTTLLRDIVRQISSGSHGNPGMSVGLVDERSEIASSHLGIPQNDVGVRTDVLDGCPKSMGIMIMVRTMSPRIIAVDEIGTEKDIEAIRYGINCGCRFIGTIHGDSIEEIMKKPVFSKIINDRSFNRYIILDNKNQICNINKIYSGDFKEVMNNA